MRDINIIFGHPLHLHIRCCFSNGVSADLIILRTFGFNFDQDLVDITWPHTLLTVSLGYIFNQSLEKVQFPRGLQQLNFSEHFNQKLPIWPDRLRSLTFGYMFEFDDVMNLTWPPWPELQHLTLGFKFNESLEHLKLPTHLESLTLGWTFNQPLGPDVHLPHLQHLTFGYSFNQRMDLRHFSALQSLKLDYTFNQILEVVHLPDHLQNLSFGDRFNQPLILGNHHFSWPSELRSLTFGRDFNQSLESVIFPGQLQELTFGYDFNQPLDLWNIPGNIRKLTFGYSFNQPLQGALVTWGWTDERGCGFGMGGFVGHRWRYHLGWQFIAWRIIPFSKWLIKLVNKSPKLGLVPFQMAQMACKWGLLTTY